MARPSGPTYRFGPFTFDSTRRILQYGEQRVWAAERQTSVLLCLLDRAGQQVSKDELITAAWGGVAVDDNSIVQVIKRLRLTLAVHPDGDKYIETVPRQGYRFVEPVERDEPETPVADVDALLAPFTALGDSRAEIETFKLAGIERARQLLVGALKADPKFDGPMIAMATALFLGVESTRVDGESAADLLVRMEQLARGACAINPKSGHAWAMLGVVRHRRGDTREGLAAVRKAVALEPDVWLHLIRLCYVTWGDERLRAVIATLKACAGVAYAHWFAAQVYVARGMFEAAFDHARRGCELQDAPKPGVIPAVGLHWLAGALLDAMGDEEGALEEFRREFDHEHENHVFGREACANSWYHTGAIHRRNGRHELARAAFVEVLKRVPTHRRALAASGAHVGRGWTGTPPQDIVNPPVEGVATSFDSVIDMAVSLALQGNRAEAARMYHTALEQAPPGSAGWQLPLEPILRPAEDLAAWTPALALLRERAR